MPYMEGIFFPGKPCETQSFQNCASRLPAMGELPNSRPTQGRKSGKKEFRVMIFGVEAKANDGAAPAAQLQIMAAKVLRFGFHG